MCWIIVVILGGDASSRREFFDGMRKRSRFFKLKVESVSICSAVMLDLEISKGLRFDRTGFLDVAIHTKETNQGAALSSSSRHVPSIHSSWPNSRLLHYSNVCTSRLSFRDAALKLLQKVTKSDSNHPAVDSIAHSIVHGYPMSSGKASRVPVSECSRLVIPYHPSLRGLPRALMGLDAAFEKADLGHLKVRISWSLAGSSIHKTCLSDCARKLKLTRAA